MDQGAHRSTRLGPSEYHQNTFHSTYVALRKVKMALPRGVLTHLFIVAFAKLSHVHI